VSGPLDSWQFELVAGPYQGPTGGVLWHDGQVLFSAVDEGRLLQLDHDSKQLTEYRRYANRVNGLGHGPNGELYGAQEGGRRLVGSRPTAASPRSMPCSTASITTSRATSWSTSGTASTSPIRAMR
jgi:hypothetical protein